VSAGNDPSATLRELLEGVAPGDRETVVQAFRKLLEAEADLREVAQRMAEAQRVAHFGNWEWDLAESRVTWSDELYTIFGLEQGRFAATFEAYMERVHPEDRGWVGELIEATLRSHEPYLFEHRILLPDGAERALRCHGQVVENEKGEAVRLVGVCQDITELAEAEKVRRAAELRVRNAFEHAPIGVALISISEEDDKGSFLDVNRAMCSITGYTREQLLATSLDELTIPEDRELDALQRRRLLARNFESYSVEKRCRHAEGHTMWVQISISLARDDDVPYGIAQVQDVSERRRFEQRLQYLADHDSLTGLMNRRRFKGELDQRVAFNLRYGGQGAVLVVDIDHFKHVNDNFGHQSGDNVIRRVATLLEERSRATDTVARLAGDEFAVLVPQTHREGAVQLAESLREEISQRGPSDSSPAVQVTVSIGVAMFGSGLDVSAEAVLVTADLAMYRAKEEGRDRVAVVDGTEEEQARIHRGLSTSARIRDALAHDHLLLFRQPILDLRNGKVERHELLLRIDDQEGGVLPAALFIETAEQFGMVQELDRWVVSEALGMLAKLQREGNGNDGASLHVNLSGSSVTDRAVLEFIERELDQGDADPRRLTFEITETAAVRNLEVAAAFADRLTEHGCSIAIDDYGAGFGPFYYLKHLPFDLIKIDGDFVRELVRSDADQLTVKAIVQIARGLGKQTIAEFVEEASTMEMLRELGVDMAQGFHVGRPVAIGGSWN
jgi:diguanylate cyclase (GGDEF)-like protein/PAS domain S-box-containing protein